MNSSQHYLLARFVVYLLVLFVIGWFAWRNTHNLADYIPGGRRLGRWATALLEGSDTEKVYIGLTALVLHPVPADICPAAILAAIMSTADAQLLVAASAITGIVNQPDNT